MLRHRTHRKDLWLGTYLLSLLISAVVEGPVTSQLGADRRPFGRSLKVAPSQTTMLFHVRVGYMVADALQRERFHQGLEQVRRVVIFDGAPEALDLGAIQLAD